MSEAELNSQPTLAALDTSSSAVPHLTVRMARLLREGGRYFVASLLALAVDYGLLVALTEVCRLHYLTSSAISYSLGVAVHYVLCVKFVFHDRRVTNRQAEFAGFFAVGLLGLVVTQVVLWLCVSHLGLDYKIAKVAATGISFAMNFVVRKALLFTTKGR